MINILAVGNSFSQDATAFIELMSEKIFVRNLYVGGCSLERHCEMLKEGAAYSFQENGEHTADVTLEKALASNHWDYITVQQVSGLSGIRESFYPFLTDLVAFIRARSSAEILLHETWAYENGSDHPDFARYERDQKRMQAMIEKTYANIARMEKMRVVPTGKLIALLRGNDFFDTKKGGRSLCRDGFHLDFAYGRVAAAALWIKFFTRRLPAFFNRKDLSEGYALIRKMLDEVD